MSQPTLSSLSLISANARAESFKLSPKSYAVALALVAALQTAILGWMIASRVNLLANGKEIVLEVVPVDPRSLFRGDYVILNYDISEIDKSKYSGAADINYNEELYVTLEKSDDGKWQPINVSRSYPSDTTDTQVVLRGRSSMRRWNRSNQNLRVRYGIEAYFVEEGEGKRLEKLVRDKKISVLVAVASSGEAAVKGLMIDGKLQYEEPLF
jgi:uncharacterized membrane-anchored protein